MADEGSIVADREDDLGFDPQKLREKYRAERDKRLRGDANAGISVQMNDAERVFARGDVRLCVELFKFGLQHDGFFLQPHQLVGSRRCGRRFALARSYRVPRFPKARPGRAYFFWLSLGSRFNAAEFMQ